MPKALSLKKNQGSCSQNQKSITQFFSAKNPQTKVSPNKNDSNKSNNIKNGNKRKASSPVQMDIIEIDDEDAIVYKTTTNKNSQNTPKKQKSEVINNTSPHKNKINRSTRKTPKKENGLKTSPIKSYFKQSPEKNLLGDKDRSPLITIQEENGLDIARNEVKEESSFNHYSKHLLSPEKVKVNGNHKSSENTTNRTPKKSPIQEFSCSPISSLITPEKKLKDILSPSKCGSTVKALDFESDSWDNAGWDIGDINEAFADNIDLSTIQRCEVLAINKYPTKLELKLKNAKHMEGSCTIEGIWLDTNLEIGDILSVLATRDASGNYIVNNSSGLLVLRPDHLVSTTSVVGAVFCKRKAILQERWRGIDSANTAMTMGVIIHELVQKALTQSIHKIEELKFEASKLIKDSIQMLYDAGLTVEEAMANIQNYIHSLADFMKIYVVRESVSSMKDKNNWSGHIDKVLDIEENLCCPELGLKGKIDATLQVTIHDRKGQQKAIVPLELKSGKASMSAEHRGQLVLYGLMLNIQRNEDPLTTLQRGLLLYLKDKVELKEVSCGYPERRDLVMLRNQLVQYLTPGAHDVNPEELIDIEDASTLLQQRLPEPVHHENACTKCPYLTLCSIHLWNTDGPKVTDSHPLSKLRNVALGHLTEGHINYFLHWTALLKTEERYQANMSPLHALWTDSVDQRVKRGTCIANLKLISVIPMDDRFLHILMNTENINNDSKATKGPQEGEFSIVSIENRPWIAAGVVSLAKMNEIQIYLERDLSRRLGKDTLYHIDTYQSYATIVQNLTNLGVLMDDTDNSERLRRLIIDKEKPRFLKKQPREVGRLGIKLMRSLNVEQQRAVLKALSAQDYSLLQGLPGTGKTQTISVLIQMLVALKQRVLVTAHTHSAVDTVLSRLPESLRIMRLGSSARVAESLTNRSEQTLTAACKTPEELQSLYESMEVVGVTCLGSNHSMLAKTMFDVCIVDEATQVLQCTVLRPLFAAKKFILVGDPEQLPPVVRSRAARRLGMEESLFHRLMGEESTCTLHLQYRMNQALADVANRVAYNGKLKCANHTVAEAKMKINIQKLSDMYLEYPWLQATCSPEPENAVLFLNMESNRDDSSEINIKSCINIDEACIVLSIVEKLKKGGVSSLDIGVIAPFRDQVALLRRSLSHHNIEVSTVDQFQGRDKSVIIFSCTKKDSGQDDRKVKEGEVLNDQRRLAVSVTRAKHKLIVIGNKKALIRYKPLQNLIEASNLIKIEYNIIKSFHEKYKHFII